MALNESRDFGIELCEAMGIEPDIVKKITIIVSAQKIIEIAVHILATQEMMETIDWQEFVKGAVVNVYHHEPE